MPLALESIGEEREATRAKGSRGAGLEFVGSYPVPPMSETYDERILSPS